MSKTISQDQFTKELFDILDETFETHHGIYLDKGTSLFETLDTINAAEASRPVGGKCASLAAQVTHVIFYLEVLGDYMLEKDRGKIDWGKIWREVEKVSPEEWTRFKQKLRETYQRIYTMMRGFKSWDGDRKIGGAMAIVVHTDYHLGEIRQALCVLN